MNQVSNIRKDDTSRTRSKARKKVPIWMHVVGVASGGILAVLVAAIVILVTGSTKKDPSHTSDLPESKMASSGLPSSDLNRNKDQIVGKSPGHDRNATRAKTKSQTKDSGKSVGNRNKTQPAEKNLTGQLPPGNTKIVDDPSSSATSQDLPSITGTLGKAQTQFQLNPWRIEVLFSETPVVFGSEISVGSTPSNRPTQSSTQSSIAPPKDRHPVPTSSQQATSLKKIKALFKKSYQDRSPNSVQNRAKLFLKTGTESGGQPIDQFVLFKEAVKDSVSVGDIETALAAHNELSRRFKVNAVEHHFDLIKDIAPKLRDGDSANRLLASGNELLKQLIADDEYATAKTLVSRLQSVARKGKMGIWIDSLRSDSKRINRLAKSFQAVETRLKKLETEKDSESSQAVGEFYCFEKGDWDHGLSYLADGTSAKMKSLIAIEQKQIPSAKDLVQAGDGWLELIKSAEHEKAIQMHALTIYQRASAAAKGLEKQQVEQKIKELSLAIAPDSSNVFATRWQVTWQNGHAKWDWAQFSQDGKFRCFALGKTWENDFQMIGKTIKMTNPENKYFMQVQYSDGRLLCRKIDTKTNRVLDQGVGVPIK